MTTEGKVWGTTTEIYRDETTSLHALNILAGGYSSRHRHRKKTNIFHVLEGAIEISVTVGKAVDVTIIKAGQTAIVQPPAWHRFKALEASVVLEIYKVTLEDPDIERADHGGMEVPEDKDVRLNFEKRPRK